MLEFLESDLLELLNVWEIQRVSTGLQQEARGYNWSYRNWQVKPFGQEQHQVGISAAAWG